MILSSASLCLRILEVTLNSGADICINLVVMNVLSLKKMESVIVSCGSFEL